MDFKMGASVAQWVILHDQWAAAAKREQWSSLTEAGVAPLRHAALLAYKQNIETCQGSFRCYFQGNFCRRAG
jgi:hypothetical protein